MMTPEDRLQLTRGIFAMLDAWGATAQQQISILGLPDDTRTRILRRFREDTPLPEDAEVDKRMDFLVAIADALRTTYPMNPQMATRWMNIPHRRFRNRTPLSMMAEEGWSGMIAVRSELDCTYAWDMTGSRG